MTRDKEPSIFDHDIIASIGFVDGPCEDQTFKYKTYKKYPSVNRFFPHLGLTHRCIQPGILASGLGTGELRFISMGSNWLLGLD